MDKTQQIEYWLSSAAHDLDVAETLFQNEKYDWCLFIGHLVIEKVLKDFYARDKGKIPPKIHNLLKLADNTKLNLSKEQRRLLGRVNDFNMEVRYPEHKFSFYKLCTKDFAEEYFFKIKELYQWLLSQIKQ